MAYSSNVLQKSDAGDLKGGWYLFSKWTPWLCNKRTASVCGVIKEHNPQISP